jgi:hypothetical protein
MRGGGGGNGCVGGGASASYLLAAAIERCPQRGAEAGGALDGATRKGASALEAGVARGECRLVGHGLRRWLMRSQAACGALTNDFADYCGKFDPRASRSVVGQRRCGKAVYTRVQRAIMLQQ